MPHEMTAVGIAADVSSGARTARDVVDEALTAAIETADLNVFTFVDADGARAAARSVDEAVAAGRHPGPLAGVPVALKDLIDQRGLPTTCGSSFYREVPARSAPVVERLEAAGAIVIGRTGLHEFALGFSSENDWFGPVRNPLDPSTSPGGSSGGSAAAVAAGIVPIALGTDTGGSVRVPAALCGCVGLKVTHGRVPLTGVFPLASSLDTVGPLAATVADAALAYGVIAGDDPADRWSVNRPVTAPAGSADLDGLRIGIPHPWVDRPLERLVASAWEATITALGEAGADVRPIDAPHLDPSRLHAGMLAEIATVHRPWFERDPSRYGPEVRHRLEQVMAVTVDDYVEALHWRRLLRRAAADAFDDVDVLLTPTTVTRRKVIGEPLVDGGAEPEPYGTALSWFTALVNQAGVPALSIPVGPPASPPASVQIIAPPWEEARLLEIGLAFEGVLAGPRTDSTPHRIQ
jgi:Asp-tRNA(Asn)/Glu-tRNA(Gln) amidotransferase A subunit family amidase